MHTSICSVSPPACGNRPLKKKKVYYRGRDVFHWLFWFRCMLFPTILNKIRFKSNRFLCWPGDIYISYLFQRPGDHFQYHTLWVNIFNSTLLRWKLSCWSFQTTLCCRQLNNRIHTRVQVNSVDSPIWTPLQRLYCKCGALCFYHPIYCRCHVTVGARSEEMRRAFNIL